MSKSQARNSFDHITPEIFVATWQAAKTAQEVANKLGMDRLLVHARASTYRRMGIKLKNMPRAPKNKLDVDHLNRIIEDLEASGTGQAGQTPEPSVPDRASQKKVAEFVGGVIDEIHSHA